MFKWLQNKSENARVASCTKELQQALKNKTPIQRAQVAAMAAIIHREPLKEIEPTLNIFDNPFNFTREQCIKVYCMLEDVRNQNRQQFILLKNNFLKMGSPLLESFKSHVKTHVKTCEEALELWMVTVGINIVPESIGLVRECWGMLQGVHDIIPKAITEIREAEKKEGERTGNLGKAIETSMSDGEWSDYARYIPSCFTIKEELNIKKSFEEHVGPVFLVGAVAENISNYFKDVKEGTISYPAYKRKNSNVQEIWIDTRIELLSCLWKFDKSNPLILAETTRQKELLTYILKEKPYLGSLAPQDKEISDTVNAIFKMYEKLNKIMHEVGCNKFGSTGPVSIFELGTYYDEDYDAIAKSLSDLAKQDLCEKIQHNHKNFLVEVKKISLEWSCYIDGLSSPKDNINTIPVLPKTLFEIIYRNITKQTKIVALSAVWGPSYQEMFFRMLDYYKKKELAQGKLPEQIKESSQRLEKLFENIISADDPDFIKPEEY